MEIEIGPYILSKRTPYSVFKLYDVNTGENITEKFRNIRDDMVCDYEMQSASPERYFNITSNSLLEYYGKGSALTMKYIFLPDDIEIIGDGAFMRSKMEYIHIPQSLKVVEEFAFCECNALKHIELPDKATVVNMGAFQRCKSLSFVKLPNLIDVISVQCFMECESLKNIIIPDGVFSIGTHAFSGCKNLESVKFGNQVKWLDGLSFLGCEKLSKIDLPDGLEAIGDGCFEGCTNLSEITLPDNISRLNDEIFMNCVSLEKINLPGNLSSVDGTPFVGSGIKTLIINNDVKRLYISDGLIANSKIDKLVIGKNVKILHPSTFAIDCEQIKFIDYLGDKKEFEEFKRCNNILMEQYFGHIKNINILNGEPIKDIDKNLTI